MPRDVSPPTPSSSRLDTFQGELRPRSTPPEELSPSLLKFVIHGLDGFSWVDLMGMGFMLLGGGRVHFLVLLEEGNCGSKMNEFCHGCCGFLERDARVR